MQASRFQARVEVRQGANDFATLSVLGFTAVGLTLALAFAVLGNHDSLSTAESIALAGKVMVGCLTLASVVLVAVLVKPRPYSALATATEGGLVLEREGSTKRVRMRGFRRVQVIRDDGAFRVELEKPASIVKLTLTDGHEAERLAGALLGQERVPAATARVRMRAGYWLFLMTCWIWVLALSALCVFPISLGLGALLTAITVPAGVWITLKATPADILVSEAGVAILHPLGSRRIDAGSLSDAAVVDDNSARIVLADGERLRLPELADHPLDRGVSTANPPAERLVASVREILVRRQPSHA
ncbi:DUF3093 family protein [Vulgatibacter incomptus]|uniref:PH domain-containing protein n=1 Tax=Vulgatibacter incomptus TaxID=1391653 RepID=A0A0K1PIQ7_9BACT|nr:DUF3093 family protein [Vulgatibacter incomptus]AKU93276.1 hypothetical protein AKJ08_3663 [Vulgatibacter incomptus]